MSNSAVTRRAALATERLKASQGSAPARRLWLRLLCGVLGLRFRFLAGRLDAQYEGRRGLCARSWMALCLQALAGQADVVTVTTSGTAARPDGAFDLVVRARQDGARGLALYVGLSDTDEVAAVCWPRL
ncbi:hypothetical protein AB5J72_49420 [Streptomyces sp. CG1]|uniref:hypothetical protein n=1 Tax=Streptomyces sp. CG1 TaxID=1287523 RepID=UPI0034E2E71B